MKALQKFLLLLILFFSISPFCKAQEYTLRDQAEITYQAQLTLSTYNQLLNVIASPDITTSDVKLLIKNSYSDPQTQVFYSADAIIEDNIKPSNLDSRLEQDKNIHDYLQYFDLTYEKSGEETVQFYDFQVSDLKYGDYLYMKVKYTCHFLGRHKEDTAAFRPVERLAEVRVVKADKQWKTYITSIVYYNPDAPVDGSEGNVTLDKTVTDDGTFSHLIDKLNSSHNSLNEQEMKAEYVDFNNQQDSLFNHYMEVGKLAMEEEKFDDAFEAYSEASRIFPWNLELRQMMVNLTKAQSRQSKIEEKKFNEAVLNGDRAKGVRDYAKAKNFYAEAVRLRPQEASIKKRMQSLEKVIRIMAIPESKYSVGEYKEAIKDYNKALKEKAYSQYFPDFYYGRGKCYEKLDDIKDAIKDYSEAIEADGNFIEALNRRANLFVRTEQPHKAIADYSLIVSNPDYAADFYPKRAKIRNNIGDHAGAIEDYDAAIKLRPALVSNYYEKGLIQHQQNQLESAVRTFGEAIRQDNEFTNAYYQRGLVYIDLQDVELAAIDFAKVREQGAEPFQLSTIENIAYNLHRVGEGDMKVLAFSNALEWYSKAILIFPEFGGAWLRKGDANYMLAEYQEAVNNYHKAIEFDSVSFAYYKRGLAYQQLDENEMARQDFSRYVPIGRIVVARAEERAKSSNVSSAHKDLFAKEQAEAWYALGYAQLETEQFAEAYESLDKAIDYKKDYPQALFGRGSAQYALNEYKKAVKDIEESIELGLSSPQVFLLLGKAYEAKGKLRNAITAYSNAILLDQTFEAAFKRRAMCYKNNEQYDLALQDMEAIFKMNEASHQDITLITNKGLLELHQKKPQEAIRSFDEALRLKGNAAWALYGKACALAHEHKMEESLELYRQAFQTKQIEWAAIKKDPLIKPVRKQKAFKELVKANL